MKILLIQLLSNGDCLLVTPVARQLKQDHPGCRISWLVARRCSQAVRNNPFVDEIIEVDAGRDDIGRLQKMYRHGFDQIIVTDYCRQNLHCFWGSLRSSLLRSSGIPLTVPLDPVLRLDDAEIAGVTEFAARHQLTMPGTFPILVEANPLSNQSTFSQKEALAAARLVNQQYPEVKFIISSSVKLIDPPAYVIDASSLSWRQNLELARYCRLLVGCSSGISWLTRAAGESAIPTVQLVLPLEEYVDKAVVVNMEFDYLFHGLDTAKIVEFHHWTAEELAGHIGLVIRSGFAALKEKYPTRDLADLLKRQCANITQTYHQTLLVTLHRASLVKLLQTVGGRFRQLPRILWQLGIKCCQRKTPTIKRPTK